MTSTSTSTSDQKQMEEQQQSTSSSITLSPSISIAQWPECAPSEKDAYFSIYCGIRDLRWAFHRTNGTWVRWRTPHISNISDDIINILRLYFPEDSEPLKYVLGDELSFEGAMHMSKQRSSTEISVFYIDNPTGDDRSEKVQDQQLKLLSTLWAAVPCKEYRVVKKHLVEAYPLLKTHENRIQDFSLEMISSFLIANAHYKHPLLTLLETEEGKLHYIGSWEMETGTLLITGSFSKDSDEVLNELQKVILRWKTNARKVGRDKDPPLTIVVANDQDSRLELKLIEMLDIKDKACAEDTGYDFVTLPDPILYGVSNLVDEYRVKKKEEARAKAAEKRRQERIVKKKLREAREKEAREKLIADAMKKAEKEKKRKKALESQNKARNESNGIETAQSVRKRKPEDSTNATTPAKMRKDNNEKDGIEKQPSKAKRYLNMKVAKVFDDGLVYFGVVKEYFEEENGEPPAWKVIYDDGDGEDLEEDELKSAINYANKIERQLKSGRKKVKVFSSPKKKK